MDLGVRRDKVWAEVRFIESCPNLSEILVICAVSPKLPEPQFVMGLKYE